MTRFPAGRRGPRSGEGVLEGKNRKETQSRAGRLSAVRITAECHIGAWPRTPYGPSRGNEGGRQEIFESYSSCTLPAGPPLVAGATTFPPIQGALWMLGRGVNSGDMVLEGKNRKETQSRAGRLSAVRITAECHIGAWPRTPYGPSRGSEGGRREIFESYSSCTLPTVPPLVAAPPPFPLFRGHYGCWAFESIYVYGGNAGKPSQPPLRAKPGCKGFRRRSGLSKLRPLGATTTLGPKGRQT